MHSGCFHPISCTEGSPNSLRPHFWRSPPLLAKPRVNVRNVHSSWTSLSRLSTVSGTLRADCDSAENQMSGWSGFWVLSCWLTFSSQHTELKGQGWFELSLKGCRQLMKKQTKSHSFVKIGPFSLHPLHQEHTRICDQGQDSQEDQKQRGEYKSN